MILEFPINKIPDYKIRVSDRAKHLRLNLSASEGLVIVVPKGFDQNRIPGILDKRRLWLEKNIEKILVQHRILQNESSDVLPDPIYLNAIGQQWLVEYKKTNYNNVGVFQKDDQRLIIRGDVDNRAACRKALRRWLSRQAHANLVPLLKDLGDKHNLVFQSIMVKGQKKRWASCSHRKNISINYKLLFLPERLVRYVFLHELCHTVVMNHSRKYWKTLATLVPQYLELNEEIKQAWKYVPGWVNQQ